MSLSKFESMLKTNNVYFFDATEFEDIIDYYIEIGKQNLAKKALSLGLEQHPESSNLLILKAEMLIFDQEFNTAFRLLKRLEAIEPNNAEVYIQQADIYSKQNDHRKAVELLDIAMKYTDNLLDVWLLIGMEYIYLNDFNRARGFFEQCLEDNPDDFAALFNVVYCFDMQKNSDKAISYLLEFIDINPYSEIAWHQLGRQYFTEAQYEEAYRAFDFASLIDEAFVGAYVEKAKTLEKLNRPKEAIENYLISLDLDDPTSYVFYRIGRCFEKLGDIEKAIKYYAEATVEDPLLEKGWYALAKCYQGQEDRSKALYYCQALLNIDANNFDYLKLYADLSFELARYNECIESLKVCVKLNQDDLGVWLKLIDSMVLSGCNTSALAYTEMGLKIHMNTAALTYRLGALHYLSGNEDVGTLILEKAKNQDPEYILLIREVFPELFLKIYQDLNSKA